MSRSRRKPAFTEAGKPIGQRNSVGLWGLYSWPLGLVQLAFGACAVGCVLAQFPFLEILLGTREKAA